METRTATQKKILKQYMEYTLDNNEAPKSIYLFCKSLQIEEKEFYEHYSSMEQISKDVYATFCDETVALISKDESYQSLDAKNKLLVFYFTFFEMLTANRSYVLLTLEHNKNILERIQLLQALKTGFKNFIQTLEINHIDFKKDSINKLSKKSIDEISWSQLLFILRFWIEDTSKGFEKTDILIEKSIHASFDLLDITPLKNLIDLGKFFFKEKIKPNL
ncbi:TetR family transcriptional regulator C-terminal domain-containing protein [Ochrovirga pacifica]|uniref:TetR family transcriptional regulator C-terminal domain-containing protein n=1 Tax=Ochrovirga pacifica TaxID=1042376 RepID=UPI000255877D|nr:TetR family transcriptional regulator C-terminal domain-containing protein [Ochrovirga pacifica]